MNGISNEDQISWSADLKQYSMKRKELEWGRNQKPCIISHKTIKQNNYEYNPILQVYRDANKEDYLKAREKNELANVISKNKDNALRLEQTFDIINHEDKLKGFESHQNYPKMKNHKKPKQQESRVEYNIVNNINNVEKKKFFSPQPSTQPKLLEEILGSKKLKDREFDIISNDYYNYNKEKKQIEKEIEKLDAANKYWKSMDYDIVKGKFYDGKKEENFQAERMEKEKNREVNRKPVPGKHPDESSVYDFVRNRDVNPTKIERLDKETESKKQRYKIRFEVEDYYKNRDIEGFLKKYESAKNKISYNRYQHIDKRGYDIISQDATLGYNLNKEAAKRGTKDQYEFLDMFGGDKKNIMKNLYRDRYDHSEVNEKFLSFKQKRNNSLASLPVLDNKSPSPRLNIHELDKAENFTKSNERIQKNKSPSVNKIDFFNNGVKLVPFDKPNQKSPVKLLHSTYDSSVKSDIFIKNIRYASVE